MWISLFKKQADGKKPVMNGVIKVTQELKDMVNNANIDDDLEVSLWNKTARSGSEYLSGRVSPPFVPKEKKEMSSNPGADSQDLPF
jgi:hypothetical protein